MFSRRAAAALLPPARLSAVVSKATSRLANLLVEVGSFGREQDGLLRSDALGQHARRANGRANLISRTVTTRR